MRTIEVKIDLVEVNNNDFATSILNQINDEDAKIRVINTNNKSIEKAMREVLNPIKAEFEKALEGLNLSIHNDHNSYYTSGNGRNCSISISSVTSGCKGQGIKILVTVPIKARKELNEYLYEFEFEPTITVRNKGVFSTKEYPFVSVEDVLNKEKETIIKMYREQLEHLKNK